MPLIVFLAVVFLVIFLGVKLVKLIFSGGNSESAAVEIQISHGRVEYYLPDKKGFATADAGQTFFEGDALRTTTGAKASLTLFAKSKIFMDENTELSFEKLSGSVEGDKEVLVKVLRGRVWVKVEDADFNQKGSTFAIETSRDKLNVRGTIFDLETGTSDDVIRLIKGNIDVDVFQNGDPDKVTNVKVGVGQKLTINAANATKIEAGQDVIEMIDVDFLHSAWHIENLSEFYPEEAAVLKAEADALNLTTGTEDTDGTASDFPIPVILDPLEGAVIPDAQDAITISGTTTEETMQVIVNGYTLTKYQPGEKQWSYFASKSLGTMVSGENTFEVVAVSKDGKKSKPAVLHVKSYGAGSGTMTPPVINTETPAPKPKPVVKESTFKTPVIIRPAIADLNEPYQTSADVVTVTGVVDSTTERVELNGKELRQFNPGDVEFKFIANAQPGYENMQPGVNEYRIEAFGPNGQSSAITIRINYTPFKAGR